MKKILILTASFGDGHNSAARALRDAIELADENARVEILDLFADSYGAFNTFMKKSYLGMVQYAPKLWSGFYSLMESPFVEKQLGGLTRLQTTLGKVLDQTQPDVVVSTYPVYGHVIKRIFASHNERPFRFITVITDSITINSTWFRAPSDYFCVANDETAEVLRKNRIAKDQIKVLGFPVSPHFENPPDELPLPASGNPRRILYVINTGKKKAGKVIDRLLDIDDVHLTICAGRDPELRVELLEQTKHFRDRVNVLGWTNEMPQLMMSHHLLITKAGGATVQEAIAAKIPMIINQVIPGQEEGNAQLIERCRIGAIAEKNKEVAALVEDTFAKKAAQWQDWRENLEKVSRPSAAGDIAELILDEAEDRTVNREPVNLFEARDRVMRLQNSDRNGSGADPQMLLCDFHIHSNYSDGKLSVPEIIDFYGEHGFDCICITDHLADPRRLLGKVSELVNMTLPQSQLGEYFAVIERERQRAWRRYGMLVMTGIEFNKDGYTKKTSAHLLGIDLKVPIDASLEITETIAQIHAQGGLAVASHPHIMKSEWGKNTLYLWENQEKFAPLLDAWEIANRNNIFNDIGLKRLPFIANSDFHKPKHIYSWKTLIHAEKDYEAIKECIRRNEHVAITLYRDFRTKPLANAKNESMPAITSRPFVDPIPVQVANS
ncbi:MAG TPA: PHP domain-containing protein [Verrucomicrobiae bacterium]|nr:PHP domain-containing protein [Verrucomicrobiae bacterium]